MTTPQATPPPKTDWRSRLAAKHGLATSAGFTYRPLLSGGASELELWEFDGGGYAVLDSKSGSMLEYSPTALSPLSKAGADEAAYLGIGGFFVQRAGGIACNVLTQEVISSRELKAISFDVTDQMSELAAQADSSLPRKADSFKGGRLLAASSERQDRPTAVRITDDEVAYRVPNWEYITGCAVLPNDSGRCGWVAASIMLRYWQAINMTKNVVPMFYRAGTDLSSRSNSQGRDFAGWLRAGKTRRTWGLSVRNGLKKHVSRQNLKATSSWNVLSIGARSHLEQGQPVILFGHIPGIGAHAVLAYGYTKTGHNIVHYGWRGQLDIRLNSGVVGSNTRFWLQ